MIKEKLIEALEKHTITKLVIFDMDSTLVKTPGREECDKVWMEKFNKPWPHKGVFSKPESLDFTIFEIQTIASVIKEYEAIKNDSFIYKVLLTGRLYKLAKEVKKLLDHHNLFFDEYLLNNRGETLNFKLFELNRLSKEFPNLKEILFFDDRDEHIPHFIELGKKIEEELNIKFVMIHVK